LAARIFVCQEVSKQNRLVFAPDPAGTAEIRDTAFGADAGARECYCSLGFGKILSDFCDGILFIIHILLYNMKLSALTIGDLQLTVVSCERVNGERETE